MAKHLSHIKSKLLETGTNKPKRPTSEQIDYGEIAINYKNDVETMFIRNDIDEIVPFYSGKVIDANEAVTARALSDLNARINDIDVSRLVETTYAELLSIVENNGLIPGKYYRITDYVTTTSQSGTQSAGHQFDVVVLALSNNTLSEDAYAILHDGDTYFQNCNLNAWTLKYCLNNDSSRFTWADSNGKGVIYYMMDEYNNECPYDFKNIQFQFKINNGRYDTTGVDTYVYTFSWFMTEEPDGTDYLMTDATIEGQTNPTSSGWVEGVHDNVIKPSIYHRVDSVYPTAYRLRGNLFIYNFDDERSGGFPGIYKNYIGGESYNNVFMNSCVENTLLDGCANNVFGLDCQYNILHMGCSSNNFGIDCSRNEFLHYCRSNSLSYACSYNKFGPRCSSNLLESFCWENTFGDGCSGNKLINVQSSEVQARCEHNIFFDACADNVLSNDCSFNVLYNLCSGNVLGIFCSDNVFFPGCSNNAMSQYSSYNFFMNKCENNTFGEYCESNNIGIDSHDNTFGNYCTNNSLGSGCGNNSFGNDFSRNNLGNDIDYCVFGNNTGDNTISDGVNNVQFSTDYVYNTIIENGNGGIELTTTQTTDENNVIRNITIAQGVNNAVVYNYIGYDDSDNKITKPEYDAIPYGKVDYYTYVNKNDSQDVITEKVYNELTDASDYEKLSITCIAININDHLQRLTSEEYSNVEKDDYYRYVHNTINNSYITERQYNSLSETNKNSYSPININCIAKNILEPQFKLTQEEYEGLSDDTGKSNYYLYIKVSDDAELPNTLVEYEYMRLTSENKENYKPINIVNKTLWKTIEHNSVNDNHRTTYQNSNSVTVNV